MMGIVFDKHEEPHLISYAKGGYSPKVLERRQAVFHYVTLLSQVL